MSEQKETAVITVPSSDIEHLQSNPPVYLIVIVILGVAIQSWLLVIVPVVIGLASRSGVWKRLTNSRPFNSFVGAADHFLFEYLGIPDFFADEGDDDDYEEEEETAVPVRRVHRVAAPRPAAQPRRVARRVATPVAPTLEQSAPKKRPLLPLLARQSFVLIHGAQSSGKTTLLCHLMDKCETVIGCNPHHEPDVWPPHVKVFGKRYNHEAIHDVLVKMESIRAARFVQMSDGYPKERFKPVLIVVDEALSVFERYPSLGIIFQRFITEADKVKMAMILGSHSSMVEPLGLKGRSDLLRNLAIVDLTLGIDGSRSAVLRVDKYKEPVELPGTYHTVHRQNTDFFNESSQVPTGTQQVPVVPTPLTSSQSSEVPAQPTLPAGDRATLINTLLLSGWAQNDIAGVVKGRRSDVLAEIRQAKVQLGL